MKQYFVPYNIALALKEKGFDEPCIKLISPDEGIHDSIRVWEYQNSKLSKAAFPTVAAPLYDQVIEWFRETHGLVIELTYASNIQRETGFRYHVRMNANYNSKIGRVFPYYEALNAAIEHAITLLP